MGTGASNGRCSDAMTLPINDWLFHLEGGTILPYCALQFLPFISIGVNRLCISIVIGTTVQTLLFWQTGFNISCFRLTRKFRNLQDVFIVQLPLIGYKDQGNFDFSVHNPFKLQ